MWTLDYSGENKSLADWRISSVTRRLVNQGRDEVRFLADGAAFDSTERFAHGSNLVFYRDGVRWFFGRVIQTPRNASGRAESQEYVCAGPWWWLEELVFQNQWWAGYSSHIILNINSNGALATIKEQIEAVLNFAISANAPLQIGEVTPWATPPADEIRDLSCAAVITKELRWALSDAVTWFDYSTDPPTFHCKLASELGGASGGGGGGGGGGAEELGGVQLEEGFFLLLEDDDGLSHLLMEEGGVDPKGRMLVEDDVEGHWITEDGGHIIRD